MNELSYLLIGILVGIIIGAVAILSLVEKPQSEPVQTGDLTEIMRAQMAYQQTQNMMRQLQLDQARQEAEMRQLEQDRLKFIAQASRLNQYDLRKALEAMGGEHVHS